MPAGEVSAAIGKSVQVRGEVHGSEDLLVDGVVEGTITLQDSRLTIGANARVKANVSARDIVVLGQLQGNLHATGRVELRAGCNVTGDLRGGRLSIEENASYSGKVDLLQSAEGKPAGAASGVSSVPVNAGAAADSKARV